MKQDSSGEYPIEQGIPAPYTVSVPITDLKPGESLVFPLDRRITVQSVASRRKRLYGEEYTVKKLNDKEARIWRTK